MSKYLGGMQHVIMVWIIIDLVFLNVSCGVLATEVIINWRIDGCQCTVYGTPSLLPKLITPFIVCQFGMA